MTTFVSLNSENGGRPGFREYLQDLKTTAAYIGLQEVHNGIDSSLPAEIMPPNPGKREYPLRSNLRREIEQQLGEGWQSTYAAHIRGYHDYELWPGIEYGQLSAVNDAEFAILVTKSAFVYRDFNQFNTEHQGGAPCGKVAIGHLLRHHHTGRHFVVVNVHGFRSSFGKRDHKERFQQNAGINRLAMSLLRHGEHLRPSLIILGDLNYRDRMIATHDLAYQPCFGRGGGLILNHEFGITRTRTKHYGKWQDEPQADYIYISRDLAQNVSGCSTDDTTPSDHMAIKAMFKF